MVIGMFDGILKKKKSYDIFELLTFLILLTFANAISRKVLIVLEA